MNELRSIAFDDGYGRGPRELLRDSGLSMGARLLWIVLEDMTSSNSLQPFPGQERLAEHLGCTARHVRNFLRELEDAGWLLITRRGVTKTNLYTLTRPASDRKQSSGQRSDRKQSSGQERNSSSYKAEPEEARSKTLSSLKKGDRRKRTVKNPDSRPPIPTFEPDTDTDAMTDQVHRDGIHACRTTLKTACQTG